MLYTSYYGNMKKLPPDARLIAISRVVPRWYVGYVYPQLAPTESLIYGYKNGSINEEQYKHIYWEETLSLFHPEFVYPYLDYEHINILLCYETPDKFCHRHLFADWINKCYGIELVNEWTEFKGGIIA